MVWWGMLRGFKPGRRFGKDKANIYLKPFMSQVPPGTFTPISAIVHKNLGVRSYFLSFSGEVTEIWLC